MEKQSRPSRKKAMLSERETYLRLLAAPLPEGEPRQELRTLGLEGTFADALAKAILDKAIGKSDLAAARFIQETLCEKSPPVRSDGKTPLQRLELDKLTDQELADLADAKLQ